MTDQVSTRVGEAEPITRPASGRRAEGDVVSALYRARDDLAAVKATCSRLEHQLAAIARFIETDESGDAGRLASSDVAAPLAASERLTFRSKVEPPDELEREPDLVLRRHRGRSAAVGLLAGVGSLLVAEAAITVVWQEPISSAIAHQRQGDLEAELSALNVNAPTLGAPIPAEKEKGRPTKRRPTAEQRARQLAATARTELKAGKAIGRIRAPRLGKSWVVAEGTGDSSLKAGPGRYSTSSLPGLPGTTAIAGHRTTYGAPFRNIDKLRAGDRITMEMPYATVEYRVEGHRIVDPSDTKALRDIGRPRLVLTACTPLYSAAQRWVVIARQVDVRRRTMS